MVFEQIAVNEHQVQLYSLPTRPPKRETTADKNWPHGFACELDAMEPDLLRQLVEVSINEHLDQEQLRVLKVAEADERKQLQMFCQAPRPWLGAP